jgi:hypothetical protein
LTANLFDPGRATALAIGLEVRYHFAKATASNINMANASDPASPTELPVEDDDHGGDLPLTMAASVVLDQLPKDAHRALETAGELEQAKGIFYPTIISATTV